MNIVLCVLALAAAEPAPATTSAAVAVRVDGKPLADLDPAALQALGAETVRWKDKAGKEFSGEGVPLEKVLVQFGLDTGPRGPAATPTEKHRGLRAAVIVTARDGYQAVFSVSELMASIGPSRAFIVWSENGKRLDDKDGPLRIVVATDKEPSRSIRQLARVEVRHLN